MKNIVLMARSLYKWSVWPFLFIICLSARPLPAPPHPLHVSVTEINHNAAEKSLEISCKMFVDDFEKVLEQNYKTKVDLSHPADKAATDKIVKDYLFKHFSLLQPGKTLPLTYIGFEVQSEAVYGYLESDGVPAVTALTVNDNLMYDMYNDQIGIVHVIVNGNRQSSKLTYPDTKLNFSF